MPKISIIILTLLSPKSVFPTQLVYYSDLNIYTPRNF